MSSFDDAPRGSAGRVAQVFLVFLRLGCLSFGGPVAHLAYFEHEFVQKQRWLSAETFTELVALSQSLPGPGSSQVGYSVGLLRAGLPGGVAAWLGFTLPSALLMFGVALGHLDRSTPLGEGISHGLQLVAVAVVAQAVLAMQRTLAPDRAHLLVALAAAGLLLLAVPNATLLAIVAGAAAGLLLPDTVGQGRKQQALPPTVSRATGLMAAGLFTLLFVLAFVLPAGRAALLSVFAVFFRDGSLVFGGGHVMLPVLEASTVAHGAISRERFLAGYGAAQALPGPLFTFGAFLGAVIEPLHPVWGGILGLLGLFGPGLLLVTAVLPFWTTVRRRHWVRKAVRGTNAAVVGVLLAALYDPIWTSSVHSRLDFAAVLVGFVAMVQWKLQPWILVLAAGAAGAGTALLMP